MFLPFLVAAPHNWEKHSVCPVHVAELMITLTLIFQKWRSSSMKHGRNAWDDCGVMVVCKNTAVCKNVVNSWIKFVHWSCCLSALARSMPCVIILPRHSLASQLKAIELLTAGHFLDLRIDIYMHLVVLGIVKHSTIHICYIWSD